MLFKRMAFNRRRLSPPFGMIAQCYPREMAVDPIVRKESGTVGGVVIAIAENGIQLVGDAEGRPQVEADVKIQCGAEHLVSVTRPEVGTIDDVVVERPLIALVDVILHEIGQREALPDGTVSIVIVRVVYYAVEGVVRVADEETLLPFPDAQVHSIMMIVGDIIVVGAERRVTPKVESWLVMEVLCPTETLREQQQDDDNQCLFISHYYSNV